jgi:hypothetical protein
MATCLVVGDGVEYRELGADYLDLHDTGRADAHVLGPHR